VDDLARWSKDTTDGSRSDLNYQPFPQVWNEVQSEHGNCLGRKCPTYNDCFYYKARRRVWNADLLVVNHALFFSDLALRREGASLLPDYDVVVLDEAHTLEAVAGDHLGLSVTSGQLEFLFNKLYNDRSRRGLLLHHDLGHCQQLVQELRFQQRDLFDDIREWRDRHGASNGRLRKPPELDNPVSPALNKLSDAIKKYAEDLKREEEKIELTAQADRCRGLAGALDRWLSQRDEDSVYWVETTDRARQNIKLVCAPIDLAPILRDELFNKVPTAILTSATLAVGKQSFEFIQERLGLSAGEVLKLGSPFDYKSQMRLILPEGMPDPASNPAGYVTEVVDRLKHYIALTDGRAFVLFTSYRILQSCA
jgi:ATP-dependent DNA helicase DinG